MFNTSLEIWLADSFPTLDNLVTAPSEIERIYTIRKQQTGNNSQAPNYRFKRYAAFRQNPIFLKDQNMKQYQPYRL